MPSDGMGRASADPKQDEHLVPHLDHIGNVLSQNLWTWDFLLDAMMSAEAAGGGLQQGCLRGGLSQLAHTLSSALAFSPGPPGMVGA